jgi:peptidyl-tRNA hydrolase
MNQVLYVILNGGLHMSPGKAAAQAVHAVMLLDAKHRKRFTKDYCRTVIVLEASGREQLDGIGDYLYSADIDYVQYIDEGANEVEAFSLTAIAVEPFDQDDHEKRMIFSALPLFGSKEAENIVAGWERPLPKKRWYETRKHYTRRSNGFYSLRVGD